MTFQIELFTLLINSIRSLILHRKAYIFVKILDNSLQNHVPIEILFNHILLKAQKILEKYNLKYHTTQF